MKTNSASRLLGQVPVAASAFVLAYLVPPTVAYAAGLAPGDVVMAAAIGSGDDGLIVVDPTTGDRTILSDNTHGTGPTFSTAEGVSFASDGSILVADQGNGSLFRVDPATGNRTVISSNSGPGTGANFSYLYAARQSGSSILVTSVFPNPVLIEVDPVTGNRVTISGNGIGTGIGLTYPIGLIPNGASALVADEVSGILSIDLSTGDRTTFVNTSASGNGATFSDPIDLILGGPGGTLLVSSMDQYVGGIYSIDPVTGFKTAISTQFQGTGPLSNEGALATSADGTIYLTVFVENGRGFDALLSIDPATGNRSILSDATHGTGVSFSEPQGIAVVPNVPEPSTIVLALLGAALAGSFVRRRRCMTASMCLVAATVGQSANAVPIQWTTASGGNGHYYDVIDSGYDIPWPTAESQAAAMTFAGLPGHLATITSQQENDFIANTFGDLIRGTWLGGFQPPGSPEPAGGWQWITGEPFVYTNWEAGEPNNSGGNEDALEFATASIQAPGVWNDLNGESPPATVVHGYVVEFERVPEPSTIVLALIAGLGSLALLRRRQ